MEQQRGSQEFPAGLRPPRRGLPESVAGSFNYTPPGPERPQYFIEEPAQGWPKRGKEKHTVPVYNARQAEPPTRLDREGIELVRQPTAVRNFYDPDEVRSVYYPKSPP